MLSKTLLAVLPFFVFLPPQDRQREATLSLIARDYKAAITLLERMLVFDPRERATAADALADPYFGALHDDNDEPDAAPFDFSFEDTRDGMPLDEKALRKEIWASSPERR